MGNKSDYFLKKTKDYNDLKLNGKKFAQNHPLIVIFKKNEHKKAKIGWTIPRFVGNAVLRNRLKRWTREFVFRNSSRFNHMSFDFNIIFQKRNNDFYKRLTYQHFNEKLEKLFFFN